MYFCMDMQIISLLLPLFFSFLILLSPNFGLANGNSTLKYSSFCSKTPYPELCNSLATNTTTTPQTASLDKNFLDFRDISLRSTLTHAVNAHKHISEMNISSSNYLGKSAWADCLELYEHAIHHVNRSITSKTDAIDAQTWLSAAIANEQTCHHGFLDFNLSSDHLKSFPFINFSKSLSNSLAINQAMASSSSSYSTYKQKRINRRLLSANDEIKTFPKWVSHRDRKLLMRQPTKLGDIVVAQDGSGNYKTISEALAAAKKQRRGTSKRFVIYVKKGVYKENVEVKKSMRNLMFIGDGIDATVITGNKNLLDGSTTFRSATFAVSGDGFMARGITIENTAGPQKHQAVALRSGSDFSIFYECSFKGYQDTLYVHSQRQFYRNCDIYGTVDFIFGDAVAVLQNCNIYLRKPMANQKNTVTAQGRKDPNENTGIVIHNSHVTAAPNQLGPVAQISYLGRPWKEYSRTVFMKCTIDGLINPAGWFPWSGNFGLRTLFYGEYMNTGSGASTRGRVKWPGFHVITSSIIAGKFTVGNFLAGESWIPATGVPFTSGV